MKNIIMYSYYVASEAMQGKLRALLPLLLFLIVALVSDQALAAQHSVGGTQGWDQTVDLHSWASGETFNVGDQLVFKYSSGLHSVVELGSETAYKNCDLGTPVDTKTSGNDAIKLNKPGTRYFTCGTAGHCDQGMKLKITIVAANAASTPTSSNSPSSTSGAFTVDTSPSFPLLCVFLGIVLLGLNF